MDEFAKTVASPYWWLSIVLVGILINLVSAYIKPVLDRAMSRVSLAWRTRNDQRRAEYERELNALVGNVELQRKYEHLELRRVLDALFGLTFALLLLLFKAVSLAVPALSIARDLGISVETSNIIFYGLSAVIIFLSFTGYLRATFLEDIVGAARAVESRRNGGL